ncbi:MAG: hypothetical protein DHS20C20_31310 [Ardenticatenaceae bacterium]|nr:MAG: hypothetical protein DHS20C20_31310 [Ardenticatenaceae bacterium]
MSYKKLLAAYEADVQFPDANGMEQLDMLMTRSEIAKHEPHLSDKERQRLLQADNLLRQQAHLFYDSIRDIADLASWRRDEDVPATQWWWYLDVITQMRQQTQPSEFNPAYLGR